MAENDDYPEGSYSIGFTIDRLPKTINAVGRKHWAVKSKENRDLKLLVHEAVRFQKPVKPLKTAKLTLTRHSSAPIDPDNLAVSFKAILDWLVEEGILENDRIVNIGMPTYRWEEAPRGKGYLTVKIESVGMKHVH